MILFDNDTRSSSWIWVSGVIEFFFLSLARKKSPHKNFDHVEDVPNKKKKISTPPHRTMKNVPQQQFLFPCTEKFHFGPIRQLQDRAFSSVKAAAAAAAAATCLQNHHLCIDKAVLTADHEGRGSFILFTKLRPLSFSLSCQSVGLFLTDKPLESNLLFFHGIWKTGAAAAWLCRRCRRRHRRRRS